LERNEKIKEVEEILSWAITHLGGNITCKVIDYNNENYRVQFFTKENKLLMPVQIPEEWIEDSNPKENLIHDKLRTLLRNLGGY
jgi:hypothetical protein